MSRITWDAIGERLFETGVDRGVLYPYDTETNTFTNGVAWNGLTAVNESPSGAEPNPVYADNIKYLNIMSAEEYAATIEALYAPDEFMECDGYAEIATGATIGQQTRKLFGFCYRTKIGSDTENVDKGYKLHLIYNCLASPTEKQHSTINENPETSPLSYSISTTAVNVTNFKPTATVEIDSTKTDSAKMAALEAILYGTDGTGGVEGTQARLPFPDEIITILGTT